MNAEIKQIKKQMDINKTESQVFTKLVREANIKGDSFRRENKKIFNRAKKFIEEVEDVEQIIFTDEDLDDYNFSDSCAIGIDGSHFPIGGVGGKWYVPYAIVRILFEKGIHNQPIVDVFSAGIDEIKEQEDVNVNSKASRNMLIRENVALENWADKKRKSLIFIDGPIIDPPSYLNKEFVQNRCNAVKKGLKNSLIIGCVKKSRDTFFLRDYEKRINVNLNTFPSDQHLFAYLFSLYRNDNEYGGMLFSKPLKPADKTFNFYQKNGVHVYTFFFQKSLDSKILRLDIPLTDDKIDDSNIICEKAAAAASDWQYPNQFIPLPVELAHQKCTINEGTAEVLYDEIITRATGSSISDIIVFNQLR